MLVDIQQFSQLDATRRGASIEEMLMAQFGFDALLPDGDDADFEGVDTSGLSARDDQSN